MDDALRDITKSGGSPAKKLDNMEGAGKMTGALVEGAGSGVTLARGLEKTGEPGRIVSGGTKQTGKTPKAIQGQGEVKVHGKKVGEVYQSGSGSGIKIYNQNLHSN